MNEAYYLPPAAFKYLGKIYEECVDEGMNLREIQCTLARKGAGRSLYQVKHDLDHVFRFTGYAASHPAPAIQSMAEFDRLVGN